METHKVYVITAYRWGDRENHSYLVAVSFDQTRAEEIAHDHCQYRGGKYACVVESVVIDDFDNDADEYSEEVYRAKSIRD